MSWDLKADKLSKVVVGEAFQEEGSACARALRRKEVQYVKINVVTVQRVGKRALR